MKKTYNFTEQDIDIINKAKIYFNEKTEVVAIRKVLIDFERVNSFKAIILKEPDYGNWKDVKEIIVGKNIDGFGSDLSITFKNGTSEGYSINNNGK